MTRTTTQISISVGAFQYCIHSNAEKVKPPPPEVPPEPVADPPSSQSRKRSESRQSPLKQSRKKGSSKAASPLPGVIVEEEEKSVHTTVPFMF